MATIAANLQAVRARIARAAAAAGRDPAGVSLLAVSKTFDADSVATACAQGQHAFGESYLQEALPKIAAVPTAPVPRDGGFARSIEWHFIGPVQSNKTRAIAEHFDWVHSVDRGKIAARLAAARPPARGPLNVCLQINIGFETTKSGVAPADAADLAREVQAIPGIRLRGLMAIPPATEDVGLQREHFSQLRRLCEALVAAGIELDTLSMGMSGDLEAAIMEGATIVRVGTAIFGARPSASRVTA